MKSRSLVILSLSMALAPTLSAGTALADGTEAASPFSAIFAITNDYRFRGQQQGQGEVAVSGELDYAGPDGFFAGLWLSNVDFNDVPETYMELDLYAGITKSLTDTTTGTLKAVYYAYPTASYATGASENDYFEIIGSLAHDFGGATGGLEVAYSPDYFQETGTSVATTGSLSVPLTASYLFFDGGISASGKVGYQWIEDNEAAAFGKFGTPDYMFYDIGLTGKFSKYTIDVRYVATDISEGDCFGGTNLCEGGVVATFSIALP
jgi:uncharacterized protein (TIGR02001 family)